MTIEYEADCCHIDCTQAFISEVARVGFGRAESLCLIDERADDEACFQGDRRAEFYLDDMGSSL